MSKILLITLFVSLGTYATDSIYDNGPVENSKNTMYEQNESSVKEASYLNTAFEKKNSELETSSYDQSDTTGKVLSINLKNLDKISYQKSSEIIEKFSHLNKYHAGLSFFAFDHNYSSKFKRIFYDAQKANSFEGSLVFSLDQKIYGESFSLNYLTGAGISFFKGSGYFSDDGSEADMQITLWVLPVDFGIAAAYEFGQYVRLLAGGGVSAVAAIQSRSDLEEDNEEKVLFQFGYGPFATLKLNFGLSRIFSKFSLGMFRDYGVTNTFLNLEYRIQSYSNFKDDFSIEANAIGAGLSFNFM